MLSAIETTVREAAVLLLGDPRLRERSAAVVDFEEPGFVRERAILARTLREFRARNGFGRAISAPQIGVAQRYIAVDLGDGPCFVVNPVVTFASSETFTMWDDCMSFPDLYVRVARHRTISLRFHDERGNERTWDSMELAPGELLQHEIDHLDGILAVDRALPGNSLVVRQLFEANRETYRRDVDYVIA